MEGLPIWEEALILMIIGMTSVFGILTFFYSLIILVNKINSYVNKSIASKKLNLESKTIAKPKTEEINPEIIAVISAAILIAIKSKVEIKSIKFLKDPDDTSWARIGRLSLIESHHINVRK